MLRTLVLAGLLIDSWRDQSPQTESSEFSPPGDTIPASRFGDTSEPVPPTPCLSGLIALGATVWEPR